MPDTRSSIGAEIAGARPRVTAALVAQLRDIDLAEDAFAEAAATFLEKGVSADNVPAWLFTAAKRKALDAVRKRTAQAKQAAGSAAMVSEMSNVIQLPEAIPDERLRLIFICCHPAIALEVRTALALKVICGLPVLEIARVFVSSEPAMFQRITRAKAKIRKAGIAFELPPRKAWAERLNAVLLTLELAYTVAYQDAAAERDGELAGEVSRLANMVAELLPQEPEALGLGALVALARSREPARVDEAGAMIPLSQQDCSLWDGAQIEYARGLLDQASEYARTGPYQVMAAIQLCHARRGVDGKTDWAAVLKLYDALMMMRPGAVVALNRAVALSNAEGAAAGLAALEELPKDKLRSLRPYHAARADMMIRLGRDEEARISLNAALSLDPPSAERRYLEQRLVKLG